jgi:hypothetical protein
MQAGMLKQDPVGGLLLQALLTWPVARSATRVTPNGRPEPAQSASEVQDLPQAVTMPAPHWTGPPGRTKQRVQSLGHNSAQVGGEGDGGGGDGGDGRIGHGCVVSFFLLSLALPGICVGKEGERSKGSGARDGFQ